MPSALVSRLRHALVVLLCGCAALLCVLVSPAAASTDLHELGVAEHVAARMAEQPPGEAVVVSDTLAGEFDTEGTAAEVRETFSRLDVPFHVYVSSMMPHAIEGREFLAALAERLGNDGIYVAVSDKGTIVFSIAVGMDAPVRDASHLTNGELAEGGVARVHTITSTYVDAFLDPDLAEKAEAARNAPPQEVDEEPDRSAPTDFLALDPSTRNGPPNLGFYSGALAGALVTVFVVRAVLLKRRVRPSDDEPPGTHAVVGAAAVGVLVVLVAGIVALTPGSGHSGTDGVRHPADRSGLAEPPHVTSTERIDRVVAGWQEGLLYVDPYVPGNREGLDRLDAELQDVPVPTRVALMVQDRQDESGGDPDILAFALAHTVGEEGVYVVLDVTTGQMGTAEFGVRASLADFEWSIPDQFSLAEEEGPVLYESLQDLPRALGQARPAAGDTLTAPEAAGERADAEPTVSGPERGEQGEGFFTQGALPGLFLVGPLLGLVLGGLYAASAPIARRLALVHGRRLRFLADREVRLMTEELRDSSAEDPRLSEATAEADVALAAVRGDPDRLDLLGAVVLARRVRGRLRGEVEEASVCMVVPLHGPAAGEGRTWFAEDSLPMCEDCLRLWAHHRLPLKLRLDGRVQWHGATDRAWTRTWYGTREPLDRHVLEEDRVAR